MNTVPEIMAALDGYRTQMADTIRQMAGERGLDLVALTPEQCVALVTEEAEWSEQFAGLAKDPVEKAGELRHAAAMRDVVARVTA